MREQPTGSAERRLGPDRSDETSDDRVNYDRDSEPESHQRGQREATAECRCEGGFQGDRLLLDAEACPGTGRLADSPACRERVIEALAERDAGTVCVRAAESGRECRRDAAALLVASGRFVALCDPHDAAFAARACRHPLEAARAAAGRGDPIARIAAETVFIEGSVRFESYRDAFGDCSDSDDPGDRDPRDPGDPGSCDPYETEVERSYENANRDQ